MDAERDRVRRGVATPPGRVAVPPHAGCAARRRDAAAQPAARVDPGACRAGSCPRTTSRPPGGNVGGDWYDAFELRDGRLIVLLGDVAGHGITAAGTMAQLRNALRAQLFAGAAPAEALNQLNDFCVHMMPARSPPSSPRGSIWARGRSRPRAPAT